MKDLVDLVLLIEAGLLVPRSLGPRLRQVYAVRDSSSPPAALPEPPGSWAVPFAAMAAELGLASATTAQAWTAVAAEYHRTLAAFDGQSEF